MSWLTRIPIDRFLLAIVGAAVLATLLPVRGVGVDVLDWATTAAIALLFFLYGARLSPAETLAGIRHWRLHLTILSFTYVLFPLLGLAIGALAAGHLSQPVVTGLIYLTLVPSTVQSSIAFTSLARGNVAGAVVSASASNILGVALTPALCWLLLANTGKMAFTTSSILDIVLQLLLPFVLGQLSRRWTAGWIAAHPRLKLVDRGSIVLVVYAAFSAGMRENMWAQTSVGELLVLLAICVVVLGLMLSLTWWTARRLGFSVEDAIAIQFCGTKKSLASGLPMAGVLFVGQPIGLLMLPLMIFHQAQLMACSALAGHYARRAEPDTVTEPAATD
ncbi:MAG: bile acid:sodium symporter family protein [Propionicimonas sp.]|uniref:bile acid:sodium symporter family protein n=1 Tax=Propionicimonas sp. TaxID=1955623 RepID=UPI002B217F1D|nr:bile acid:sodium symporter family protein [Propionicimonas sp.]MEA4943074.1 bile acid:sodium symporter family protein [Propionicimonas sp.]